MPVVADLAGATNPAIGSSLSASFAPEEARNTKASAVPAVEMSPLPPLAPCPLVELAHKPAGAAAADGDADAAAGAAGPYAAAAASLLLRQTHGPTPLLSCALAPLPPCALALAGWLE